MLVTRQCCYTSDFRCPFIESKLFDFNSSQVFYWLLVEDFEEKLHEFLIEVA